MRLVIGLAQISLLLPLADPNMTDTAKRSKLPLSDGPLSGTDHLGCDLASRLKSSTRLSRSEGFGDIFSRRNPITSQDALHSSCLVHARGRAIRESLKLASLSKSFPVGKRLFYPLKAMVRAVQPLSLTVQRGEVLGIVEESELPPETRTLT